MSSTVRVSTVQVSHRVPRIVAGAASALAALAVCTACSSHPAPGIPKLSPATTLPPISPAQSSVTPVAVTGSPAQVAISLAARIGCQDVQGTDQVENDVAAEISCLLHGDNTVIVFAFADNTHEDSWYAAGMQAADDSGTLVMGPGWVVEPNDTAQASQIRQVVGGTIAEQV